MFPSNNFMWESISIACTIVAISFIIAFTYLQTFSEENRLKSANIESAISKGIDPMAVRCAYADSNDRICLAYAITQASADAPELRKR
jgi:hypothetical protein